MFRLIALLIGYLIGMFQTGYFMGKIYGIDIREHGSKNAGMTNVNRTLGKKPAFVVFVIDIIKAIIAFLIVPWILHSGAWYFDALPIGFPRYAALAFLYQYDAWAHSFGQSTFAVETLLLPGFYAGIGAVLGHNFPVFLKFRGGKGISSTLGLILILDWRVAVITFLLGIVIVIVFKYISLASLAITFFAPVLLVVFGYDIEAVLIAVFMGALAWFMHRDNIKRLLSGAERKFSLAK